MRSSRKQHIARIILLAGFLLPLSAPAVEVIPSTGVRGKLLGSLCGPGVLASPSEPFLWVGPDSLAHLSFKASELKKAAGSGESFLVEVDQGILYYLRDDQLASFVEKIVKTATFMEWKEEILSPTKGKSDDGSQGLYAGIELPKALPSFLKGKAGLKVSGRQKISLGGESSYEVDAPDNPDRRNSKFPQLQMQQELRVNLKGHVGDKISVLVDHDSVKQHDAKNKIRIRYEGTEDEIIQEIEAGNTSLSLGSSARFISSSFSHQGLFGIRGRAQIGPARVTVIASKEESQKQTKSFTGQAKLDTIQIKDTGYVHNQYYSVVMEPGSAAYYDPGVTVSGLEVYKDDQYAAPDDYGAGFHGICYLDPENPSAEPAYEGTFSRLIEGDDRDYNVSLATGILELKTSLQENYVLAVLYTTAQGQVGYEVNDSTRVLKLIKPANMTPESATWAYELRNGYYLGSRDIDSDRFRLKIKRKVPSGYDVEEFGGKTYLHLLGLDDDNNGLVDLDQSRIDFVKGILFFPYAEPFNRADVLDTVNTALYQKKYSKLKPEDHLYYLEASYELLQSAYRLSPLMLEGSVVVKVNGKTMTEGKDYDLDFYELRFRPGVIGGPDDQIRISYEVRPLFASSQRTLLGTRFELPLGGNTKLGATWMYQGEGGPTSTRLPRFGEEPRRAMVAGMDGMLEFRPVWLTEAVNHIPFVATNAPSSLTLEGEIAHSMPNPNTRGSALLDDMEGTRNATALSLIHRRWTHGSLPEGMAAAHQDTSFYWYNFGQSDAQMKKGDIYPDSLLTDTKERQDVIEVLNLRLHPRQQDPRATWISIQTLIQAGGTDLSEREFIEVLVRGDEGVLRLDFGAVSEDRVFRATEPNNLLDEEDRSPRNGIFVQDDEDTGLDGLFDSQESGEGDDPGGDNYVYDNDNPQDYRKINGTEGNKLEDTEDLDGNGQLDTQEEYFSVSLPLVGQSEFVEGEYLNGWRLFRFPLEGDHISSMGNADWSTIEYCRLWVSDPEAQDEALIQLAGLEIVGSTWLSQGIGSELDDVGEEERFRVKVRNNKEDPEYEPPFDPGEDERTGYERKEQSLVLGFEGMALGHWGSAYQSFYRDQDYSGYEGLAFWIRSFQINDTAGLDVAPLAWIRLGANEQNYYEIRLRVEGDEWHKVEVDIGQLTRTKIEGRIVTSEGYMLQVVGSPSITKITRLTAGVENPSGRAITGEVWIDDLHLVQVKREQGTARRVSLKFQLADLATMNADYQSRDATYRRLDQRGSSGATSSTSSGGLSTRISLHQFLPDRWGVTFPISLSWTWNLSRPRLAPGSDTPLTEDERRNAESADKVRRTSASLNKTKPSRNPLVRATLDRLRLSFSQTHSRKASPSRADTSRSTSMSLNWDWSPGRKNSIAIPYVGQFHYLPSNMSFGLTGNQRDPRVYVSSGDSLIWSPMRYSRTLTEKASLGFQPFKALSADYTIDANRDLTYDASGRDLLDEERLRPTSELLPFWKAFKARETGRTQKVGLQLKPRVVSWFDPSLIYDTSYRENHNPALSQGAGDSSDVGESSDVREVGSTTSREIRATISMNQLFSKISEAGGISEDGDGKIKILKLIGSLGGKFQAVQGNYRRSASTKYRDLGARPGLDYQLGLVEELPGVDPYDTQVRDSWGLSGGVQLSRDLRLTARSSGSLDRKDYSEVETGNRSTTFPDLDLSWSGFHKLKPFKDHLMTSTIRSAFKHTNGASGRYEDGVFEETSASRKDNFSPRLSMSVRWKNDLSVTMGDTYSKEVTEDFSQARTITKTGTRHQTNLSVSYAFSAPRGMNLPIFGRMKFKSDLRLSFEISRAKNQKRNDTQLSADQSEWSIRPEASYDFGVVDSGLQMWVTQTNDKIRVKKFRRIGLRIWIQFPF